MIGDQQRGHGDGPRKGASEHAGFHLELLHEFGDGRDLNARLAAAGLHGLEHLEAGRDDDPEGRIAASTAISSNGFIDILTLASSTPEPSGFTRIFTL
jgi:hypothetical protein